jgi:hypothetical protein
MPLCGATMDENPLISGQDTVTDNAKGRPSVRDFFTNMNAPMPLPRKLYLLLRNLGIRFVRRSNCCGHHGEPGC